jgi:transcriptional regulator with XRE-family HTH domain
MTLDKRIAKRIKELRIAIGKTQEQLSFDIGSHSYISQLEMGIKTITIETLDKVCKGLNVTFEQFFNSPLFK